MNRAVALRWSVAIVLVSFMVSLSAADAAVTITNRDEQDRTITLIEGDKRTVHVLKPSQTLNGVCEKGCNLRIDGDDEDDPYQLKPDVAVSIEDGILYYEPDAPALPQSPAPGQRPKSGVKGNRG